MSSVPSVLADHEQSTANNNTAAHTHDHSDDEHDHTHDHAHDHTHDHKHDAKAANSLVVPNAAAVEAESPLPLLKRSISVRPTNTGRGIHRILLVRHGTSLGNVDRNVYETMPDAAIPLSSTGPLEMNGVAQAKQTGAFVKSYFDKISAAAAAEGTTKPKIAVIHSCYRRARETASAIVSALGTDLVSEVRESILIGEQDFGIFEGTGFDKLTCHYPREYERFQRAATFKLRYWCRVPLGESRFDVCQRVSRCFDSLFRLSELGFTDFIIVAHGVTNRAFQMMWMHHTPEWFEASLNPDNCSIFEIDNRKQHGAKETGYIWKGYAPPREKKPEYQAIKQLLRGASVKDLQAAEKSGGADTKTGDAKSAGPTVATGAAGTLSKRAQKKLDKANGVFKACGTCGKAETKEHDDEIIKYHAQHPEAGPPPERLRVQVKPKPAATLAPAAGSVGRTQLLKTTPVQKKPKSTAAPAPTTAPAAPATAVDANKPAKSAVADDSTAAPFAVVVTPATEISPAAPAATTALPAAAAVPVAVPPAIVRAVSAPKSPALATEPAVAAVASFADRNSTLLLSAAVGLASGLLGGALALRFFPSRKS